MVDRQAEDGGGPRRGQRAEREFLSASLEDYVEAILQLERVSRWPG